MSGKDIFEHIADKSELSLMDFVSTLSKYISLTKVEYDYENETEWYRAYDENFIEVNISRPYDVDTLHEWDNSVPIGFNFSISLISDENTQYDSNLVLSKLIPKYKELLSKVANADAIYHRGNYFS